MSEQSYTTRAEAEAPPADLIRALAIGPYNRMRAYRPRLPPFDETEPSFQEACRLDAVAAIKAAEALGYRLVRGPA
jgi:hypothetical protein